jgi:hypothetical protein
MAMGPASQAPACRRWDTMAARFVRAGAAETAALPRRLDPPLGAAQVGRWRHHAMHLEPRSGRMAMGPASQAPACRRRDRTAARFVPGRAAETAEIAPQVWLGRRPQAACREFSHLGGSGSSPGTNSEAPRPRGCCKLPLGRTGGATNRSTRLARSTRPTGVSEWAGSRLATSAAAGLHSAAAAGELSRGWAPARFASMGRSRFTCKRSSRRHEQPRAPPAKLDASGDCAGVRRPRRWPSPALADARDAAGRLP